MAAKHASALKQQRQSLKRRARNRKNLSQLKTQVKKLRGAVSAGDGAAGALPDALVAVGCADAAPDTAPVVAVPCVGALAVAGVLLTGLAAGSAG